MVMMVMTVVLRMDVVVCYDDRDGGGDANDNGDDWLQIFMMVRKRFLVRMGVIRHKHNVRFHWQRLSNFQVTFCFAKNIYTKKGAIQTSCI